MIAWLDGAFVPLAEARVPALDRGFVYGDGVYEMIPVYSRRPFRLDEHLRRLHASLAGIRLASPYDMTAWRALIGDLVARQDFDDQSLYLQVTRGVPGANDPLREHAFPAGAAPTVFLFSQPLLTADAAQKAAGVCAITAPDPRWQRCDIKAISALANVLMRQQAVDAGCAETVMLRDGHLTEGAASNIFVVRDGVVHTPPPSAQMLTGITYDVVLELAAANAIPTAVGPVSEAALRAADELWMTSSTREIMPIVVLDGAPVGAGVPGLLARRMDTLYQTYKQDVMRA